YKTWDAYDNQGWPAEYLVDASGRVRHEVSGEGDYPITESLIRRLLVAAHPGLHLPPPTSVPNLTPSLPQTPESYLGYDRLENFAGSGIDPNQPAAYQFPSSLPPDELAFSGTWNVGSQEITAGGDSRIELSFSATDVYLVLGGTGTVGVSVNGVHTKTIDVSGIPRLYTLVGGPGYQSSVLTLNVAKGIEAYDFTFG
ncbi:MAG: cytochrome c biogenesis protein DipZ, partial [Acidimicrobiales bacterium]